MFKYFTPPPPAIKFALIATTLALSAFSLNAHATLTSYTANGEDLVYSSVSDVTWTKDGNLLGTLIASQGFNTVVNAIIAASPTISNTPNAFNPSGTYTLSAIDFTSDGKTTWFGALGYVNYLNSINYAGSNNWALPTVANATFGYETPTNGIAKGDELVELYYGELNSSAVYPIYWNQPGWGIQDLENKFVNEQVYAYWSSSDLTNYAWGFGTNIGSQFFGYKNEYIYAWAVNSGHISAVPVPEPEFGAMLLLGLGLVGFASRRRQSAQ